MNWILLDGENQTLGRLASQAAGILIGKDQVDFAYNKVADNKVVITNASKIAVTGNKMKDKIYYKHTNYPGGIKQTTLGDRMQKDPTKVIVDAVKGMLPNNKLRQKMLNNLYVYASEKHPHEAQLNAKNN